MKKGKFIVFEGIDGSGKGTQIQHLLANLKRENIPAYMTFEPTDGPIGSLIRNILRKRIIADEQSIAGLFLADRIDHINNDVNGMLKIQEQGKTIVCDRYYFSTYAYHGSHVPMDWLIEANELCGQKMRPDIVFYIDITPDEALERIKKGRTSFDLFENKARLTLVKSNYEKAFEMIKDRENIVYIDGARSEEEIASEIWRKYLELEEKAAC